MGGWTRTKPFDWLTSVPRSSADASAVARLPPSTPSASALAALLAAPAGVDDPAADGEPGDAGQGGALILRLGEAATTTAIAAWMGWTMERTAEAMAELDRRLERCGLGVDAEVDGRLRIRERVRLRSRPQALPFELLVRLDDDSYRHALAHLVRGENCAQGEGWAQPLMDLGAAISGGFPAAWPADALRRAFAGVRNRVPTEGQFLVVIEAPREAGSPTG